MRRSVFGKARRGTCWKEWNVFALDMPSLVSNSEPPLIFQFMFKLLGPSELAYTVIAFYLLTTSHPFTVHDSPCGPHHVSLGLECALLHRILSVAKDRNPTQYNLNKIMKYRQEEGVQFNSFAWSIWFRYSWIQGLKWYCQDLLFPSLNWVFDCTGFIFQQGSILQERWPMVAPNFCYEGLSQFLANSLSKGFWYFLLLVWLRSSAHLWTRSDHEWNSLVSQAWMVCSLCSKSLVLAPPTWIEGKGGHFPPPKIGVC